MERAVHRPEAAPRHPPPTRRFARAKSPPASESATEPESLTLARLANVKSGTGDMDYPAHTERLASRIRASQVPTYPPGSRNDRIAIRGFLRSIRQGVAVDAARNGCRGEMPVRQQFGAAVPVSSHGSGFCDQ